MTTPSQLGTLRREIDELRAEILDTKNALAAAQAPADIAFWRQRLDNLDKKEILLLGQQNRLQGQASGAAGQGTRRFHVGPFSMHTTTLSDMSARSSAILLGYWIGRLVLLVGSVLTCCIGAVPGLQAADGVCSWVNSSLGLYLYMVASIALILFFVSAS